MKRFLPVLFALLAVAALAGCAGGPKTPQPKMLETVLTPDILEHKGTALGAPVPSWVLSYVDGGAQAIEKLPEYKGKYVIVLDGEGGNRQGAQIIMDNMDAPVQISRYLSTRVQQKFAGAQVGDRNLVEEYFENTVKLVSEAKFSGFQMGPDWWVYLQYYRPGAKSKTDVERRTYRVIRIYAMDKEVLQTQLDKYLNESEKQVAKTPEKQRAIDQVQNAFYEGF